MSQCINLLHSFWTTASCFFNK